MALNINKIIANSSGTLRSKLILLLFHCLNREWIQSWGLANQCVLDYSPISRHRCYVGLSFRWHSALCLVLGGFRHWKASGNFTLNLYDPYFVIFKNIFYPHMVNDMKNNILTFGHQLKEMVCLYKFWLLLIYLFCNFKKISKMDRITVFTSKWCFENEMR